MKVLVVDDYESAAFVTARIFEMMSHDVDVAYSGAEALNKVKNSKPDLILLDIGMPEMDGFETCQRIRNEEGLENVRIIAQTGRGDDETIDACVEAGFNEHLLKPVEIKHVQDILDSMKPSMQSV